MALDAFSANPDPGQRPSQFAAAYRVLENAIADRAFPGCAFGVFAAGQVQLCDALGRFIYDDAAAPVTAETVFDVASVTKVAATTAAAMLLHQRGKLDLDTPVGELLPGFVIGREPGSQARHVRVSHLLAHSSGLPGYAELYKRADSAGGVLRACLELPIEAVPGARYEYSDPGFILLGKAIEVITREPLPSWTEREIFDPLEMTATRFNPPARLRAAIPPTEVDEKFRNRTIQGEVQDENAWALGGASGHAGLFSNVPDLLRFAGEIIAAGAGAGTSAKLFHASTVDAFAERQPPAGSSRALGWDTPSDVDSSAGRHFSARSIGHLGFSGCSLWIDRQDGVAIVLLTNRTWPDRANRAIRQVQPLFHDAVREAL